MPQGPVAIPTAGSHAALCSCGTPSPYLFNPVELEAISKVNLRISKEVGNLSCSRELLYECFPGLHGRSTQDMALGDAAGFRGYLLPLAAGKEHWAAPPGERPDLIHGQVEPQGCSWPVPEPAGGEWGTGIRVL